MYSQQLQDQVANISQVGQVDPVNTKLLDRSMSAYLQALAGYLNADINPPTDPFLITLEFPFF